MRCAPRTRPASPATLTVIGESAAGRAFSGVVGLGQAVRIFTGAPMPEGADAIGCRKTCGATATASTLAVRRREGENLRPARTHFSQGEALIQAVDACPPRDVALAAAANHVDLQVRRQARVAVLATGDELVAPGGTAPPFADHRLE